MDDLIHIHYRYQTLKPFFLIDRRNGKAIINSHTQVEVSGFESRS